MYRREPTAEEIEQSGFAPEDFASDPVDIWPENFVAYNLFASLGTQWRNGPSGPTGLDYNVMFCEMDRMTLEPDEYEQLKSDLRVMENHALQAMYQK